MTRLLAVAATAVAFTGLLGCGPGPDVSEVREGVWRIDVSALARTSPERYLGQTCSTKGMSVARAERVGEDVLLVACKPMSRTGSQSTAPVR